MPGRLTIGVDMGGSKLLAGAVDADFRPCCAIFARTAASSAPRTTLVMRLAAHDLIEHLRGLDASAFEDQAPETRAALLRAAVHALRGLRTARAAG